MGNLSRNLNRHEFLCKCGSCGFDTADSQLVEALQDVTDHFKAYIIISGGNRCATYNDALRQEFEHSGGKHGANTSVNSQHIYGRAADFKLFSIVDREQIAPLLIYNYLDNKCPHSLGLGLYVNRVHLDTKTGQARRWVS